MEITLFAAGYPNYLRRWNRIIRTAHDLRVYRVGKKFHRIAGRSRGCCALQQLESRCGFGGCAAGGGSVDRRAPCFHFQWALRYCHGSTAFTPYRQTSNRPERSRHIGRRSTSTTGKLIPSCLTLRGLHLHRSRSLLAKRRGAHAHRRTCTTFLQGN